MNYFAKRLFTLIITLFLVSLLAFLAFQVISDPAVAILGTSATPESLEALRHSMGLDRPVLIRYFDWLGHFLMGDFGTSYNYRIPIAGMLAGKLGITAAITILSFVIMVLASIPIGILAARFAGSILDRSLTVLGQICMAIPAVLQGILFTWIFGLILRMFIPGRFIPFSQSPSAFFVCIFFPALSIALPRIAMTAKMLRSSILQQMGENYVITAYSRGNSTLEILRRHVLRNAMIPVITFIASSMTEIVASCIIVEQVFAVPGMGVLLLSSIGNRDFPVVLAIVMILAIWVVAVNFIADLLYQIVDPRIRLS